VSPSVQLQLSLYRNAWNLACIGRVRLSTHTHADSAKT
jgi:hypothetical protein